MLLRSESLNYMPVLASTVNKQSLNGSHDNDNADEIVSHAEAAFQ